MITELTSDQHVRDLDDFLSRQVMPTGTMIVTRRVIKSSDIMQGHGIEPVFMVFQHIGSSQMCHVVELKDGHEFDTRSSAKEHANLRQLQIPTYLTANPVTSDGPVYASARKSLLKRLDELSNTMMSVRPYLCRMMAVLRSIGSCSIKTGPSSGVLAQITAHDLATTDCGEGFVRRA